MNATLEQISFPLTIKEPTFNPGEQYAGTIISADGTQNHHIILLAESREDINWQDAMGWAKSIGGDLPNRCESALLFAPKKDQFANEWHWTNEQHADYSDYAWVQGFDDGHQDDLHKSYECRARAVRRVLIQESK